MKRSASPSSIHREEIVRRRRAGQWPRAIAEDLGVTHNSLAMRYGVAVNTIEKIISGETWSHLQGGAA